MSRRRAPIARQVGRDRRAFVSTPTALAHTTGKTQLKPASSQQDRPLGRIHDTARQMLREGLPIKCVEAVFLALYLTAEMEDIDRIPARSPEGPSRHIYSLIDGHSSPRSSMPSAVALPDTRRRGSRPPRAQVGFKSSMSGHVHRHIVLLVRERATGQFGALGISRRKELAYKASFLSASSAARCSPARVGPVPRSRGSTSSSHPQSTLCPQSNALTARVSCASPLQELKYSSCSEILADFRRSYEKWWHEASALAALAARASRVHAQACCIQRLTTRPARLSPPRRCSR